MKTGKGPREGVGRDEGRCAREGGSRPSLGEQKKSHRALRGTPVAQTEQVGLPLRASRRGGIWGRFVGGRLAAVRGDDPRAKPDWALVGAILWELESNPNFSNCAELTEVRRLYDAGEIDAAFNLLGGVLPVARSIPPTV